MPSDVPARALPLGHPLTALLDALVVAAKKTEFAVTAGYPTEELRRFEEEAARARLDAALGQLVADLDEARKDRDRYMALAIKHGHHATATLDKRTRVLKGDLMIAGELIDAAKFDAIAESCATLAKKFRAAYEQRPAALASPDTPPRATPPTTTTETNGNE